MRTQWLLPILGSCVRVAVARGAEADQLLRSVFGDKARYEAPRFQGQEAASIHARSDYRPRFLNKASSKFAVNGTGVPDVGFDVGESYAVLLPVTGYANERDHLYFWFFPTINEEHRNKKEIPGCSSLFGLLQENGPFLWQAGTLKPEANPWSWHRLTNVVWIEQPVTVGFSKGKASARDEDDLAKQFLGFWKNFVDTFGMHGWKVYVAAESYGGYYGPYISSHMLDTRDRRYYNLEGLIVYDGLMFDNMIQSNVIIGDFVQQHHELMPLDDSTMRQIRNISEHCGFTDWNKKYLTYPPLGPAPHVPPGVKVLSNGTAVAEDECSSLFDLVYEKTRITNPCFNVYNILDHCPKVYDPLADQNLCFDREDVKRAIHAPLDVQWVQCVDNVFNTSTGADLSRPPDKYELPNVIDKTKNVIIAHGGMDLILPLNGVPLGLQNMTWGGKMGFQTAPSDPFYVPLYGFSPRRRTKYFAKNMPAGSGVQGTTHHERGLILVVTQLAGHEGPGNAQASAFRHLEKLIGRVHSLSDKTPFTLPQLKNITQVKGPLGKGTVKMPA